MIYRGIVKNGVVVLDGHEKPPEGAEVTCEITAAPTDQQLSDEERARQLSEELLKLAATMKQELPIDASRNVDHYLYGQPKR